MAEAPVSVGPPPVAARANLYGLVNTALLAVATSAFVVAAWSFRSTMKSFDQACHGTTQAMKVRTTAPIAVTAPSLSVSLASDS